MSMRRCGKRQDQGQIASWTALYSLENLLRFLYQGARQFIGAIPIGFMCLERDPGNPKSDALYFYQPHAEIGSREISLLDVRQMKERQSLDQNDYWALPIKESSRLMGVCVIPRNGFAQNDIERFAAYARLYFQRYWLYQHSSAHGDQSALCIIGDCPALLQSQKNLNNFAAQNIPVLITGETGTGKELWARALHLLSNRQGPFLSVNCAFWDDKNTAISHLFGHKKGSYTGAYQDSKGIFIEARDGTVFLDEIAELSLDLQALLLRSLDYGEVTPLGKTTPTRVDVRIVAATNKDLQKAVEKGEFREDLYYRIKGARLHLPALRERGEKDILELARYFAGQLNHFAESVQFDDDVITALASYPWPGNIRQLRYEIHAALCRCEADRIRVHDLSDELRHFFLEGAKQHIIQTQSLYRRILAKIEQEQGDFWRSVYTPFRQSDLSRGEVKSIIEDGLQEHGDLRALAKKFNIRDSDYRKFYLFLHRTIFRKSCSVE